MGSDLAVVRAARVSYNAAWRAGEDQGSDARLIRYLWKNGHTSPFESVTFTFEVKAPIFVFRQWHRHRTWSYNELSGRYRELPEEFYIPDPLIVGQQSKSNKQARDIVELTDGELSKQQILVDYYASRCKAAFEVYEGLLKEGWPRELARMVLPVSVFSHMFCTVDLLNLLKFIGLRDHDHAQYEIRQYAKAMKDLIRPLVPHSIAAFDEGLNGNGHNAAA
jgi:thymidylate synthase (FAD)